MLKEMEDVVINLRRRHGTSRILIGSILNVSLAPSLNPPHQKLVTSLPKERGKRKEQEQEQEQEQEKEQEKEQEQRKKKKKREKER